MSEIEISGEVRRLGDAAICNAHPGWTPDMLAAFATGLDAVFLVLRREVLESVVEDVAKIGVEGGWEILTDRGREDRRENARRVLGLAGEGEG